MQKIEIEIPDNTTPLALPIPSAYYENMLIAFENAFGGRVTDPASEGYISREGFVVRGLLTYIHRVTESFMKNAAADGTRDLVHVPSFEVA